MRRNPIVFAERSLNALELSCICLMLLMAFTFQIVFKELPCPLCLLQRLGFLMAAFGLLMNLRFGLRPSHYAMTLLGALFTSFVALRQVALHVVPGTGAYGNAFLGFHLYTWCFIISMLVVISTTFLMSVDRVYNAHPEKHSPYLTNSLFAAIVILLLMNIIGVLMECGLSQCPDNPLHYIWLP